MNNFKHSWFAETFKPVFLDRKHREQGLFKQLISYRRLYRLSLLFMVLMALGPLTALAIMGHFVTKHDAEALIQCRLSNTTSNARQAISFCMEQRKTALAQVAANHTFQQINDTRILSTTLSHLNGLIGGFLDLAVIDHFGIQLNHAAPYEEEEINYSQEKWFQTVVANGTHISDISLESYSEPHLFIAVKQLQVDGSFYILRAALSGVIFDEFLTETQSTGAADVFLVNRDGFIQTPSRYQGGVQEKIDLPLLSNDSDTHIVQRLNDQGESIVEVYADVASTPFIMVWTEPESVLMKPWYKTRQIVLCFLALSSLFIVVLVYALATRLVNEVFIADQQRLRTLRKIGHSNKLASIGRLAAGVGHEINNPLAVINEKAGLIQDIISFKDEYKGDKQLAGLVNSILTTVKRCGTITRHLLDFARHLDEKIEIVNLKNILAGILDLLHKESEYRKIKIIMNVADDIPVFECDHGKLQQIFLNLINNSFAAMKEGGTLTVSARHPSSANVVITIADDGCGIPEEDIDHIFEPFYFTMTKNGGTGLGLSITYALVQEIGGSIKVTSEVGKGTQFTVEIPLKYSPNKR
jgi:signal transduction histidine kinase